MTMITASGRRRLISRRESSPLFPGRRRSSNTTSTLLSWRMRYASSRDSATWVLKPRERATSRQHSRTVRSSSTINRFSRLVSTACSLSGNASVAITLLAPLGSHACQPGLAAVLLAPIPIIPFWENLASARVTTMCEVKRGHSGFRRVVGGLHLPSRFVTPPLHTLHQLAGPLGVTRHLPHRALQMAVG